MTDPRALRGDPDALAAAVGKFLTRTGLFDRDFYAGQHPEAARTGIDPLHHFMRIGIQTGASFTSTASIARLWREVLKEPAPVLDTSPVPNPSSFRAAIYVSSVGNFFMNEIAGVLHAGFADAGVPAQLITDRGEPAADATHHIVVAPHEFFGLGHGRRFASDEFVSRAIMYSTEQVQTQWFARSLAYLLRAKAVADLNEQTAAILHKGGIRAFTVQPGFTESFVPFAAQKLLPDSKAFASLSPDVRNFDVTSPSFAARPLDVLFLGSVSPKRERLFASFAPKFADLNTFIYATRMTRPIDEKTNPTASPEVTAALLQRSKVLLNIHRDDNTYFEWWRLMQAFWQKTLVVTEPCFPHPVYKDGMHFLAEAPRHMPHLIDWLVRTPDGQKKAEEIRTNAYATFVKQSTARAAAFALLRAGEAA